MRQFPKKSQPNQPKEISHQTPNKPENAPASKQRPQTSRKSAPCLPIPHSVRLWIARRFPPHGRISQARWRNLLANGAVRPVIPNHWKSARNRTPFFPPLPVWFCFPGCCCLLWPSVSSVGDCGVGSFAKADHRQLTATFHGEALAFPFRTTGYSNGSASFKPTAAGQTFLPFPSLARTSADNKD